MININKKKFYLYKLPRKKYLYFIKEYKNLIFFQKILLYI